MDNKTTEKLVSQCYEEYKYALHYRNGRMDDWHDNEDLYYLRKQPTLNNRANYTLPEMPKYIDTLLSKTDDPPVLSFEPTEGADKLKAKKVSKAWEHDSDRNRGDWEGKDIFGKKQNAIYGRTTFFYDAYQLKGRYFSNLELIDVYDFLIDPTAGGENEEDADYLGVDNIFRSKSYFKKIKKTKLGKSIIWNNVDECFEGESRDKVIKDDNELKEKDNRYEAIDLNYRSYSYKSDENAKLISWYTTYEGKRYNVLFSPEAKKAIRVLELKDKYKQLNPATDDAYWPFATWAFNADKFEFWSPSPADRLRDNIKIQSVLMCQAIDNRNFANYGMIGYDPDAIKNPALLKPRPQGLVPIKTNGGSVHNKLFQFKYPEIKNTIELSEMLSNMSAQESGITPEAQGMSDKDKKVGVYYGNIQQVADRMGLKSGFYKRCYQKLGLLYLNGLKDNYTEKEAIRVLGEDGVNFKKLLREDVKPNYDVTIRGSASHSEMKVLETERKNKVLIELAEHLNVEESMKTLLENSGFDSDEVQRLTDKSNQGGQESVVKAKEENQKLALKKEVKPYRKATPAHIRVHLNFVQDEDLKPEVEDKVVDHIQAELPIATKFVATEMFKNNLTNNLQPNVDSQQAQGTPTQARQRVEGQGGRVARPSGSMGERSRVANKVSPAYKEPRRETTGRKPENPVEQRPERSV